MKYIKNIFHRHQQLLLLMLAIVVTPSAAHAHGVEQFFPYVGLSAFIVGLIAGVICTLRHISIGDAVLPSFGIYLIILAFGSLLLLGKILWSDYRVIILTLFFGILVGFIPLVLGIVGMSFALNFIIRIFKKTP